MAEPEPIGPALTRATERLRAAGSPSARLDAEVLASHAVDRDRSWVLAHPEATLDAEAAARFVAAVERRAAGEPVAYIRGFKEWQSMRIRTDRRALVPRPETELLADAAVAEIERRLAASDATITAWEVATGSGAVAVFLARRFRTAVALGRVRLVASDISPDALELTAENLAEHGVSDTVSLACADLLEPAGRSLPRPDVVIANLPYVASDQVDARSGSLGHEPRVALDGGPDGLAVLRRLFGQLETRARPAATVLLEIGADQGPAVAALAPRGAEMAVVPDLAQLDRVVRIDLPD
ncbi:MAG: peptide chain release factor N(5)-glutamine methyltransferase [Chloroflexi bacterium]|nr:peptide chain release factor N(5)-glutamine methyltransferase [Chloroflexota bacterium]